MKKGLALIFSVIMLAVGCTTAFGCAKSEKPTVTVNVTHAKMLGKYAAAVQAAVPDVNVEFAVGGGSLELYELRAKNNDLPDILMLGGVVRDALNIEDYLRDLKQTEAAAGFSSIYCDMYRSGDGTLKWLPLGGGINGILANKKTFDKYGISLPTDYPSFETACKQFGEHGVTGFSSDFKYGYTCQDTLEGFSVPLFRTSDGIGWWQQYNDGQTHELDEALWKAALEKELELLRLNGLTADAGYDIGAQGYGKTRTDFMDGKTAMIRETINGIAGYESLNAADIAAGRETAEVVFLPFFGENASGNWLHTESIANVAVNGKAYTDKQYAAVMRVLDAMFSETAINGFSEENGYTMPYNNVHTVLPERHGNIREIITQNRVYISQTDAALGEAETVAVKKLIAEEDVDAAFAAMKETLAATLNVETPDTVATLNDTYSDDFDVKCGRAAASAVANTLKKVANVDMILMPSSICIGPVYAGECSKTRLECMMSSSGNAIYFKEMTGEDIFKVVKSAVEGCGNINDPIGLRTLPVSGGFEMAVKRVDGKFVLTDVTTGGVSIQRDKTYKFAYAEGLHATGILFDAALGENSFKESDFTKLPTGANRYVRTLWSEYIEAGNQPEAPTAYITVK